MTFERQFARVSPADHDVPRRPRVVVQRRLSVGAADDPLEVEADRTADAVMRILRRVPGAAAPPALGSGARTRIRRHEGHVHPSGHEGDAGPEVGLAGGAISDELSSRIARASGGAPLGDRTRQRMEHGFGVSFAAVRVHAESDLPRQVAADAFTTGNHLHFAPGRYDPSSTAGEHLLAHELTHVVQQGGAGPRRATAHDTDASRITRHACHDGCHHHGPTSQLQDASPMLADELLHVMRRTAEVEPSPRADTSRRIRRHASWEHKMLGDVDPETLEVIAAGRDVAAAARASKPGWFSSGAPPKTIRAESGQPIDLTTVLHTIDQEIRRLKLFQSHPPVGKVADATAHLEKLDADGRKARLGRSLSGAQRAAAEQAIDDAKWGVRLVSLRLQDGTSFLVTYGEMNTLADFYGSAEEIAQTPAANFRDIVGGVREESIRKFMRLRNELTVDGPQRYEPDSDAHRIAGAIGNKGTLVGAQLLNAAPLNADQFGELKLMGKLRQYEGGVTFRDESRAMINQREETSYTAGLGRNACHFAPHSWHSWATAHNKAVALAQEAWTCKQRIAQLQRQNDELRARGHQGDEKAIAWNTKSIEALTDQAADKLNAALIENGFGDHFLQDSYAAGHLINKTLIMQWFALWLDKSWNKRSYSADADWRQIQQVAYGQDGLGGRDLYDPTTIGTKASNDPQSVENLGGHWTARFEALGLKVPSVLTDPATHEFDLFTWWQGKAADGELLVADWKDLHGDPSCPVKHPGWLKEALIKLIDAGVVYFEKYSSADRATGARQVGLENMLYSKNLCIKREYIPKQKVRFQTAVLNAKAGDTAAYTQMAKAVTYADYHKFLNHGYLQLASNVLHDHFCSKGLRVATAAHDEPYVIYGDNAMLGKESAKMVKFSAETSHQSRDSIYEIAASGTTTKTTQHIAARFPTYARPVGAPANLSLAKWHEPGGSLQTFCNNVVFDKDVAALLSKSTAIASDNLTGKISKDATQTIHAGEAF